MGDMYVHVVAGLIFSKMLLIGVHILLVYILYYL